MGRHPITRLDAPVRTAYHRAALARAPGPAAARMVDPANEGTHGRTHDAPARPPHPGGRLVLARPAAAARPAPSGRRPPRLAAVPHRGGGPRQHRLHSPRLAVRAPALARRPPPGRTAPRLPARRLR